MDDALREEMKEEAIKIYEEAGKDEADTAAHAMKAYALLRIVDELERIAERD